MNELDEQAQKFAIAFGEQSFPGPDRLARARSVLMERAREQEHVRSSAPSFRVNASGYTRLAWALATIVVCGLAVTGVGVLRQTSRPPDSSPDSQTLLTRSRSLERTEAHGALHQEFQVEVAQVAPKKVVHSRRLSIWTDPEHNRFAARYTDEAGEIRHGLFQPAADRNYVYRSGEGGFVEKSSRPSTVMSLADLASAELNSVALERSFLRWLEERQWRPIALSGELAAFASEDGVALRVTRISPGVLAVSAQRAASERRVEMLIEIDSRTHRARIQRLRLESEGRIVEVRLTITQSAGFSSRDASEFFRSASLARRVFPGLVVPGRLRTRPERSRITAPPRPSEADLLAAEVEVRYVLHRVGACTGGAISISRDPEGFVAVTGVVETSQQHEALLATLGELRAPDLLKIRIDTYQPEHRRGTSSAVKLTVEAPRRLPIEAALRRHFRGHSNPEEEITRLTNGVVSSSEAALAESWCLRRLAAIHESEEVGRLQPQSRWLLEVMLDGHMRILEENLRRLRSLIEPVAPLPMADRALAATPESASWPEACGRVFREVEKLNELVLALFVGGGSHAPATTELARAMQAAEVGSGQLRSTVAREVGGRSEQTRRQQSGARDGMR